MAGYAIIALALALFVQCKNVYPQLLLARLLFSIGGAAVSTMVTAVLPSIMGTGKGPNATENRTSMSSELTITPGRFVRRTTHRGETSVTVVRGSTSRLAGFVGMCAGCGALLALAVFLPLPARFEKSGLSPSEAIRRSYYVVSAIALVISVICFVGLRNLHGEEGKGLRSLKGAFKSLSSSSAEEPPAHPAVRTSPLPYWRQFSSAFLLGFKHPSIGLGYMGGFVARASSVGISLFIPLFVNNYYKESGLCHEGDGALHGSDLGSIKKSCPKAYILAAILTGVSQLVALICAPGFGFLSEKARQHNLPLLFAALAGMVGYTIFPLFPSPRFSGPEGNLGVFAAMALIGMSQIGAIVCSLAVLSNGVLEIDTSNFSQEPHSTKPDQINAADNEHVRTDRIPNEEEPLLAKPTTVKLDNLRHLKGSIAGMYSFYGGAGILLLTKLGGFLFDVLSTGAPFYILASFNGILMIAYCFWLSEPPALVEGQ